jgi:hypothetical protein
LRLVISFGSLKRSQFVNALEERLKPALAKVCVCGGGGDGYERPGGKVGVWGVGGGGGAGLGCVEKMTPPLLLPHAMHTQKSSVRGQHKVQA